MRKLEWFRPRPMRFASARDWMDRAVTEQRHGWNERSELFVGVFHLARRFHEDKPAAELERRAREAELLAQAYPPGMMHELLLALAEAYWTIHGHRRQQTEQGAAG